jgi:predicted nucleic acid-binding protein
VRVALDTNILAYAEGVDGEDMRRRVLEVIQPLDPSQMLIPVQALGELFNVLVRKGGRSRDEAGQRVEEWRANVGVVDTSYEVLLAAVELSRKHQLFVWDAVMLAAAAQAGCRALLSEDMQHGFTWGRTTIVNPLATPPHPLLDQLRG